MDFQNRAWPIFKFVDGVYSDRVVKPSPSHPRELAARARQNLRQPYALAREIACPG